MHCLTKLLPMYQLSPESIEGYISVKWENEKDGEKKQILHTETLKLYNKV